MTRKFPPFVSFLTPTYQRPEALLRCMGSVSRQNMVEDIEHVIVCDYVGLTVGGMFSRVRRYVDAVHGTYVHLLADDDVLAAPDVVSRLSKFADRHEYPPAIAVRAEYEQFGEMPSCQMDPPEIGHLGLSCLVTRYDVWRRVVLAGGYGDRYEGDYDFAQAVHDAGYRWKLCDILLTRGRCNHGEPEPIECT